MKKVAAIVAFIVLGLVAYGYWEAGKLRQESEGWTTREVALREMGLDDSELPRSLTRIRFLQRFGFGHGSDRYFVCDGKLDELTDFAKKQFQPYVSGQNSSIVIDPKFVLTENNESHPEWMRPEATADLVAYRSSRYSPLFIIMDPTNGLLYYYLSD
jgi:hypothetical protein